MELFAESYEIQALHDENQWLLQRLDASERSCKQLQRVVKQQARRIEHFEAAAANAERDWRMRLEQREKDWMHEYNVQMEALLRIVQHHESARAELENRLQRSTSNTDTLKVSSATQTESSCEVGGSSVVEPERHQVLEEPCELLTGASGPAQPCESCKRACSSTQLQEQLSEGCSAEPAAIQVGLAPHACHEFTIRSLLMLTCRQPCLVQRLRGSMAQLSSNRPLPPRRFANSVALSSRSETDFRTAILQRLRRPAHYRLPRSSVRASVPSTILEDSEGGTSSDSDAHSPHPGRSDRSLTPPTETATSASALQSLEEQNRVLHERLTSQQAVLDQFLMSKLQDATAPSTVTRCTRDTHEHMIKLQDHGVAATSSRTLCIETHRPRLDPALVAARAGNHPLSPSAA